ncbi:MAG: homoserine kinase [Chloroflexota bacterium]
MAVKTPFSQQDFNYILSQYDLGAYTFSTPVTQGTVQTNYFIRTIQGKFVFRYYENRSKESVLFESELLMYLKKYQYPCPAPVQNKQGTCVGTYSSKPYMIFEFIDGQNIDHPDDHHKQQLIQKVAELQNLTRAYQPRHKKYRWNYDIELCRMLASTEAKKINTDNAREKLSWLENQLSVLDLPKSFPKGICHCDFHLSNVLFQDDQFSGLLDFDDANYTYLVFDLVGLIDSWAWPFQSNKLDLPQAREIVQEYIKHRPLSAIEQRHIFDVHKLSILLDCVWYFGRGQANDFHEKGKIEFLNNLGWKKYAEALFFT